MIKEALELLLGNAVRAAGVSITPINGDPTQVIVSQNGTHIFHDIENYRAHVVNSLDSMLVAIARYCEHGTVWHCEGSVVAVTDDGQRLDSITLPLVRSEQFTALAALKPEGLDQRAMIRLLRHDLANCTDGTLLPLVRKVEFKSGSTSRADIERGHESLGRSVNAAVSISQDLPDLVTVSVPVYKTDGVGGRVPVACSLDVNLQTERFVLTPLPGELQRAMDAVQGVLHAELSTTETPVFYGRP